MVNNVVVLNCHVNRDLDLPLPLHLSMRILVLRTLSDNSNSNRVTCTMTALAICTLSPMRINVVESHVGTSHDAIKADLVDKIIYDDPSNEPGERSFIEDAHSF